MGVPLTWQEWHAIAESRGQTIDRLARENAKLRKLAQDYHRALTSMCEHQDCDACKLRDEGACERGVLTARACVLGVEVVE